MTKLPGRKLRALPAALVLFMCLTLSALVTPQALASGSSATSRNGLTCPRKGYNTLRQTNCTGSSSAAGRQKWRLHVACAFQGDYTGPWNQGPGSDGFECNFSVQNANVQWG